MKGFRVVLVVLVCVAAAIGGMAYYQEWFHVTVDKDKFEQDKKDALARMQYLEPAIKDKAPAPTEKRRDQNVPQGAAETEMEKLQGTWRVVSLERDGETASDDAIREQAPWVFKGDKVVLDAKSKDGTSTYNLDSAVTPKTIDVSSPDAVVRSIPGIYSLDGDTLKLCLSAPATPERPADFSAKKGSLASFYVLKREKP